MISRISGRLISHVSLFLCVYVLQVTVQFIAMEKYTQLSQNDRVENTLQALKTLPHSESSSNSCFLLSSMATHLLWKSYTEPLKIENSRDLFFSLQSLRFSDQ